MLYLYVSHLVLFVHCCKQSIGDEENDSPKSFVEVQLEKKTRRQYPMAIETSQRNHPKIIFPLTYNYVNNHIHIRAP